MVGTEGILAGTEGSLCRSFAKRLHVHGDVLSLEPLKRLIDCLVSMVTGRGLPSFFVLGKARMMSGLEITERRTGIAGVPLEAGLSKLAGIVLLGTTITFGAIRYSDVE